MEVVFDMSEDKKKNKAQELGKIEKPEADKFQKGRKLIFVPLLFAPYKKERNYRSMHDKYWHR
jgi:hypothetical protein